MAGSRLQNNRIPIEEALRVLNRRSPEILTVTGWARSMGYSRSHFCRRFTREFRINPKDYLKHFRYRLVLQEIKKDPEAIGYKIALNAGFPDEKALYKFLQVHFHKNLSALRERVLESQGTHK